MQGNFQSSFAVFVSLRSVAANKANSASNNLHGRTKYLSNVRRQQIVKATWKYSKGFAQVLKGLFIECSDCRRLHQLIVYD